MPYPILNPTASSQLPYDGEIARHEHLANYTFHDTADHVPRIVVLHTRLSTLQSVNAFGSSSRRVREGYEGSIPMTHS